MINKDIFIRAHQLNKVYFEGIHRLDELKGNQNFQDIDLSNAVVAVDDVSFDFKEGERIGIIGENGAGKSTLLKIIAGTAKATSGEIDISGNIHAALTIGLNLQQELSGRENLYLDAEIREMDRDDIEPFIEDMIEFADLGEFIDMPVKTYSSGMKARLAFTSLVFVEPEILLLDETLSTGDQWFQKKAQEALQKLCDSGRIVIIVAHSMEAIRSMCTRCIWMKDGKIIADGDPFEVTSSYSEYQRKRSDQEMMESFFQEEACWVKNSETFIDKIKFFDQGQPSATNTLMTGQASHIEIGLNIHQNLSAPFLRLKIERVDGLKIIDQIMPESLSLKNKIGHLVATAQMKPLVIAPGLFKCEVHLGEKEELIASRSLIFKIDLETVCKGGRPVLVYPMYTKAKAV